MPLALGCLLGGPFTAISIPSNILVTDALRPADLRPFGLFEFTPITAAIVAGGILFVVLVGRRLLPRRDATRDGRQTAPGDSYELETHIFTTRIPKVSILADLLFRDHYGLSVLAIWRKGRARRAELRDILLQFGDALLVYGQRGKLASLFFVTVMATQVVPTAALVALMSPVALNAAANLNLSPHLLMMTVAMALRMEEEKASSEESANNDLLLQRTVRRIAVDAGERLVISETIRCIRSPHDSFVQTRFQSYAVEGTIQVNISGMYNSAQEDVAKTIHEEVLAAVRNRPLKNG